MVSLLRPQLIQSNRNVVKTTECGSTSISSLVCISMYLHANNVGMYTCMWRYLSISLLVWGWKWGGINGDGTSRPSDSMCMLRTCVFRLECGGGLSINQCLSMDIIILGWNSY